MKTKISYLIVALCLIAATSIAQEIHQNQVPSVIVNNFKKEFPKARDIEWEQNGDLYNVEFEIGFFTDFEAWFNASGELIKYSEEISKKNLPKAIKNTIKNSYSGYTIDDVKKFTENKAIIYYVEIEKGREELTLMVLENGKLL
jgi:hypothetical protein